MAVKLFVLGLPGSGKSTIARYIKMQARDKGWEVNHFNDYRILQDMFLADSEHKQFKSADHGGFDIIDFTAFDIAIPKLEQEVTLQTSNAKPKKIILIEFARNDYQKAFQQFSSGFLQNVYILYLNVDIETCKRRVRERINNPTTPDDHFVSEYIFTAYYNKINGQDIPQMFERVYGFDEHRVKIIDNNCSLEVASKEIDLLSDFIMDDSSNQIDMPEMSSSDFDKSVPDDLADESANNPLKPTPAMSELLVGM